VAEGAADDWTENRLLGGRVLMRQPRTGYRAAIDPVLLAAAVAAAPGEHVLDVGCGAGAAALCLAQRADGVCITGIDQDPALIAAACENAAANALDGRLQFLVADLLEPNEALRAPGFDHVIANPPHLPADSGQPARDPGRRTAAVEGRAQLADWAAFCIRTVRPGGTVTWLHRADRLPEIVSALGQGLGSLAVYPLWPGGTAPKPAKRILITGRRGARGPFRLLPGLVLHRPDGHFTAEAEAVLRHAGAIAW
jgi:tRNA1(Val) A37 N6-methylase TrmN6